MPSKRPQRTKTPWPAASARTRLCVNGAPRGLIKMRGREAASARIDGARQHIGLHHHAGAAAGRRIVDAAVLVRGMLADVDRHRATRGLTPAPCRRGSAPSGPGNISGKIVSTLARHIAFSLSSPRRRGSIRRIVSKLPVPLLPYGRPGGYGSRLSRGRPLFSCPGASVSSGSTATRRPPLMSTSGTTVSVKAAASRRRPAAGFPGYRRRQNYARRSPRRSRCRPRRRRATR